MPATTKTPVAPVSKKAIAKLPVIKPKKSPKPLHVLHVDSSFFATGANTVNDSQQGCYVTGDGGALVAPLIIPVGAKLHSITVYYVNTSDDSMQVNIVRKHADHHAFTEEFLVSFDELLPGAGTAPDYFAKQVIDHFGPNTIQDNYLYSIEINNTGKTNSYSRLVRGMRIAYWY